MRRAIPLLAAALAATGLSACGTSRGHGAGAGGPAASSDPTTLLRQSFASTHTVRSGVLAVRLSIRPHGSSRLRTPLSLSLSGPFRSDPGHRPESQLAIAFSGAGRHVTAGVTVTASAAFVTFQGTSYRLPAADFRSVQRSLGSTASGSAPGLSSFGIDPETWVSRPRIVGTATVDGVATEHLHATVDVRAFLLSLNKVLAKESSTLRSAAGAGGAVPTHISSAQAAKIASAIRSPTVDIYTGKADSTLRRLVIDMSLPVHGSVSSGLGGLRSAQIHMSVDYTRLGEPQTITPPAHARSFSALQSSLQGLASGTTGTPAPGAITSASGSVSKYEACIQKAAGQVARMQKCAALLTPAR